MKEKLLVIVFMAITNAFFLNAIEEKTNNNSLLIYGKVTTVDDEVYTGQIRWGDEEAFWFDFFNSIKPKNENLKYLSEEDLETLNKKGKHTNKNNWNWSWGDNDWNDHDHTHVFACQFGDISSIDISGKEKVYVNLKNGDKIKLKGGSNDIGADIQVTDEELGHIKLDWKRVAKVEFMNTPSNLESYYGDILYGTVSTDEGDFTGYVQWDHDERLANDELNGDSKDGEMDIAFGSIKTIKKRYDGSEVTLNSGRSFELSGTNDVEDDNRGIIVNNPKFGRVDIEWDEFKSVNFSDAPNSGLSYADFKGDTRIKGTVTDRSGNTYRGDIIYDLDEMYTLEMLNGIEDDIEYFVPFSLVRSISPLNREESSVELKDGKKLVFEDKVDVNSNNDGLLVFKNDQDYTYIHWDDVKQIRFDN